MIQYTLTEVELSTFSDDAVRAEIRSRVAATYPDEETIIIADVEGNEWDRVSGNAESVEAPPVLTDEERELRLEDEAKTRSDALRLETVLRPIVMTKLRSEARAEVREKLREGVNATLELQAFKASLKKSEGLMSNRQKIVDTRNRAEVERLKSRIDELTLDNEKLRAENTELGATPKGDTLKPPRPPLEGEDSPL